MLKLAARTHLYEDSGTALHLIYDRKTRKVYVCVWESASGDYIALSKQWLKDRVDKDIDPTPELMKLYGNKDEEE